MHFFSFCYFQFPFFYFNCVLFSYLLVYNTLVVTNVCKCTVEHCQMLPGFLCCSLQSKTMVFFAVNEAELFLAKEKTASHWTEKRILTNPCWSQDKQSFVWENLNQTSSLRKFCQSISSRHPLQASTSQILNRLVAFPLSAI